MILHWDQLVLHYGREVSFHRSKIEAAGQTTYALLCQPKELLGSEFPKQIINQRATLHVDRRGGTARPGRSR
ncbi:MAG: hypothetical protein ACYC0X_31225 [Pirellulaceae bacterium]